MQLMIIDTIDVCDACMFFLNWQVQRIMRTLINMQLWEWGTLSSLKVCNLY